MNPDSPFSPVCTRQSFLETVACGEAMRRLEAGLGQREPFLLLTGEPGTGKTTLAHEAIARWDARVAAVYLAYSALTGGDLLEEIVLRFGGQPADAASRPKLLACFERSLAGIAGQGKVAMVVVDDAQKMPLELLEELRLLANAAQQARHPLEVWLIGLPALETLLDDPALAALRQRISVRARLERLSAGETRRYLRHRVTAAGGDGSNLFPRKTCLAIAELTDGVPRRINALATEALRLARAAGAPAVQPEHLRAAGESLRGAVPARAADEPDDAAGAESAAPADPPRAIAETPMPPVAASPAPPPAAAPATALPEAAQANEPPAAPPAAVPRADAPAARPPASPAPVPARPLPPAPPVARPPAEVTPPASAEALAARASSGVSATTPAPAPPASHDPGEWVSRFVGDRGPLVIGSQAMASAAMALEEAKSAAADSAVPSGGTPGRPRSGGGSGVRAATSVALAAIVVVAAVVIIIRAGAALHARRERVAATASTLAPGHSGDTSSAAPSATTSTGDEGSSSGRRSRSASAASPTGRFTLEVGEFGDYPAALEERERMQRLTGIEGWVIPAGEGVGASHRVVLGIYRTRERATAAARMLVATHTLRSVNVVPLPRRNARR